MRIGIDIRLVYYTRTGFFRYIRGILESLSRSEGGEEVILLVHPDFSPDDKIFQNFSQVPIKAPLFCEMEGPKLDSELEFLNLDLLHFPFSLFPEVTGIPCIVTVHDLTCKRFPSTMEKIYRTCYLAAVERLVSAAMVVTDSKSVRQELLSLGHTAERLVSCYPITPQESEHAFANFIESAECTTTLCGGAEGTKGGYVLSVGSLEPRKNWLVALRAYERLRQEYDCSVKWWIATNHGWQTDEFCTQVNASAYRQDILILENLDDRQLADAYRKCDCFLSTSLYEGFGYTVLEALTCGAPVLTTPVPSLSEAGYPASSFIPVDDTSVIAKRLYDKLSSKPDGPDPQHEESARIAAYYREFGVDRFRELYRRLNVPYQALSGSSF